MISTTTLQSLKLKHSLLIYTFAILKGGILGWGWIL
jgi:hypothetical protein